MSRATHSVRPDLLIEHGQYSTGRSVIREVTYDRKLDRALRDTFAQPFLKRLQTGTLWLEEQNVVQYLSIRYGETDLITDETLWGIVLKYLLGHESLPRDLIDLQMPVLLQRVRTLALDNIRLQLGVNMEQMPAEYPPRLAPLITAWVNRININNELVRLHQFVSYISPIVKLSQCYVYRKAAHETDQQAKTRYWKSQCRSFILPGSELFLTRELCFVRLRTGQIYVHPLDMLLLWHNKACDVISVLLSAQTMAGVSLSAHFYDTVLDLIRVCVSILLQYKHKSFAIFKTLEALCVGETLISLEGPANGGFLRTLCTELLSDIGFDYQSSDLALILRHADIPERHELSCLSKLFGHPYVDMKEGSNKLYEKTTDQFLIDMDHVNTVTCYVKENFIRNYILRHGSWPPVEFELMNENHALRRAQELSRQPNDPVIERNYGKVDIRDYMRVHLQKCLEFDRLENVLPHLKDRTISVLRSKVFQSYLSNVGTSTSSLSWKDTRLLLAYLINPGSAHDHLSYLDRYNDSASLEDLLDYLIIRIVPKERELKEVYRGFGCKTYEDRMRSICQEFNVMSYLESYSDEQAMAVTELELQEKLVAFRQLSKAYPQHKILNVVIDASSWNNKFRDETVRPVMTNTLDPVFGTTIFGKTHLAYQKSLMYVPDKTGTWYWEGQDGGIEGLNQDTWVVVYIAQIKSALADIEIPYHILCKGDDMRVCFAIPPAIYTERSIPQIRDDLVGRISKALSMLGHTIKTEESYGSESYFAFSKAASVNTIELPQTLRKIQKVYGASNAFVATLDEYIGAAFSNAHSACKVGVQTCGPYYVACYWSYWHLLMTSEYHEMTNPKLLALLLVPNMLGGFPIIYLHNMPVRAESDFLPPFLCIYKHLKAKGTIIADYMESFMCARTNAAADLHMLLVDPYALPIEKPPTPAAMIRTMVKSLLKKVIQREEIREVIDMIDTEHSQRIIEAILSADPCHVKIMSTLFSATPEGILNEIVRKFESCRSVMELVISRGGIRKAARAARLIISSERKLQRWRAEKLNGAGLADLETKLEVRPDECPTKTVWRWRELCWGREIHGITQPPLQHVMFYTVGGAAGKDWWADHHHFYYHLRPPVTSVDEKHISHYSTGSLRPFLGHTTQTGTIAPQVRLDQTENILVKLTNLLDLIPWLNVEGYDKKGNYIVGNGVALVDKIMKLYTTKSLKEFLPLTASSRGTGTIQHHVRAPSFRESIVPNTLINVYTRFLGESDTHLDMKQSGQHYMYNFLHGYCHTLWLNNLNAEFTSNLWEHNHWWGMTVDCSFCMGPLLESPMMFDVSKLSHIQLCPLAVTRIGEISLRKMHQAIQEFDPQGYDPTTMHQHVDMLTASYVVLHEVIDALYYRRIDLARRYGDTAFDDEALRIYTSLAPKHRSKEVGKGEIKRIPTRYIYEFIMGEAHLHLTNVIRDSEVDNIPAILATIEASTLPWYGLCKLLQSLGRLPGLVHYAQRQSGIPAPVCFNSSKTAAIYLGSTCLCSDLELVSTPSIYVVSGRELARSQPLVARQIYITLSKLLIGSFFDYLARVPHHSPGTEDQQRLWIQALWCLYQMQDIEFMAESLINHVAVTKANKVCLTDLMRLLQDDWDYIRDDYHLLVSKACRISRRMFSSGVTRIDVQRISDDVAFAELDNVTALLSRSEVSIIHVALPACVYFLRKLAPLGVQGMRRPEDEPDPDEPSEQREVSDDEALRALHSTSGQYHSKTAFYTRIHDASSHPVFKHSVIKPSLTYEVVTEIDTHMHNGFVTDNVYLNIGGAFQCLGDDDGSLTTGMELLSLFGTYTAQPERTIVACLADGAGGMTSSFLYRYTDCQVVFHTRPDDVVYDPAPHDAISTHPTRSADILWDHLLCGHHDLSMLSTYTAIERYNLLYHYIAIDIEYHTREGDMASETVVYQHLIAFILRNAAVNCIFWVKVDMNKPDLITMCASQLISSTSSLLLYKPRSTSEGKYAYIAGVIRSPKSSHSYTNPMPKYVQVATQVLKIIGRYRNTFRKLAVRSDVLMDWGKLAHEIYIRAVHNMTPSRAIKLLQITYHLPKSALILSRLSTPLQSARGNWSANRDVIQNLIGMYDPRECLNQLCMTEDYDPVIRVSRRSYETHAHLIVMMLHLARYEGFYKVMYNFSRMGQPDILCYSSEETWRWFSNWWYSLQDNQRLSDDVDAHSNYHYAIHGQYASLYKMYVKGVEDAICVLLALLRTHDCL